MKTFYLYVGYISVHYTNTSLDTVITNTQPFSTWQVDRDTADKVALNVATNTWTETLRYNTGYTASLIQCMDTDGKFLTQKVADTKKEKEKVARVKAANTFLATIASCGRKFFLTTVQGKDRIAYFYLDSYGRLWFVDDVKDCKIYVAYKGEWKNFSQGGTMEKLIRELTVYITKGTKIRPLLYPSWACEGDVWGYGEDMNIVRCRAKELGITS